MEKELTAVGREMTPWLLLLQKYYQTYLCKLKEEEWEEVLCALKEAAAETNEKIKQGFSMIFNSTVSERQEMQYEFNRLFIGPDVLLAPPYESIYRNPEKTLMQAETLKVREKYLRAGLEITKKNVEPDDFIAFEIEFLLYLFSESSKEREELAKCFLEEHLLVWYKDHINEIRKNTEHAICLGMALILEGVMDEWKMILSTTPQS